MSITGMICGGENQGCAMKGVATEDAAGALRAAAGKALVLVDQGIVRLLLPKAAGDVLTAHLYLILDALALADEFGFSGIDRKDLLFWWCTHSCFLSLLYWSNAENPFPISLQNRFQPLASVSLPLNSALK